MSTQFEGRGLCDRLHPLWMHFVGDVAWLPIYVVVLAIEQVLLTCLSIMPCKPWPSHLEPAVELCLGPDHSQCGCSSQQLHRSRNQAAHQVLHRRRTHSQRQAPCKMALTSR
eukprot:1632562-Amphidinium_carterae.2